MNVGIADLAASTSSSSVQEYFRCPDLPAFGLSGNLHGSNGFFRFGPTMTLYGQTVGPTSPHPTSAQFDSREHARIDEHQVFVPFDVGHVVDNLRYETYVQSGQRWLEKS